MTTVCVVQDVPVIIVWQREYGNGRQLLHNSIRVLARPSKAIGYRGEQGELLVLGDGVTVGAGDGESVAHSRVDEDELGDIHG